MSRAGNNRIESIWETYLPRLSILDAIFLRFVPARAGPENLHVLDEL